MANISINQLPNERIIPDPNDYLVVDSDKTYKILMSKVLNRSYHSGNIPNVPTPTNNADATNKDYVDNLVYNNLIDGGNF